MKIWHNGPRMQCARPFSGEAVSPHDTSPGEGRGENDRSATGFLAPPDFEAAADRFFAEPETSFRGWERAIDAQARIVAAVDRTLETHDLSVPGGGGMVFGFSLVDGHLLCDWTPIEAFGGFS